MSTNTVRVISVPMTHRRRWVLIVDSSEQSRDKALVVIAQKLHAGDLTRQKAHIAADAILNDTRRF